MLQQTPAAPIAQSRVQAAAARRRLTKRNARASLAAIVLRLMASMLRDLEAINAGADRAVLANPVLTRDLSSAGARLRRRSGAHGIRVPSTAR